MKGKLIYLLIVLFFLLIILSLPLIQIPISVSSPGIVTDLNENHPIVTTVSGRVTHSNIKRNNQFFKKGDTLFRLNTEQLIEYNQFQNSQISDYLQQSNDLLSLSKGRFIGLQSSVYKNQAQLYFEKDALIRADLNLASKEFERIKKMFDEGILSQSDYDKSFFKLESLKRQLEANKEEHISRWQSEKRDVDRILRESKKELSINSKKISDYIIKSPINGRIINLTPIQSGGYINQGVKICDISPEEHSIVKVQVSPKDIGFIKINQRVKIQVDAFNHNQWGLLEGNVVEIQNNISIDEHTKQPYFTIICATEKDFLQLKNGYKGNIIKGMTVSVRFYLLERTLWQLLFDNIDDWFNPKLI